MTSNGEYNKMANNISIDSLKQKIGDFAEMNNFLSEITENYPINPDGYTFKTMTKEQLLEYIKKKKDDQQNQQHRR